MSHQDDSSLSYLQGKKVIVAGAGIAGLSLVIALYKQYSNSSTNPHQASLLPFELVVYERDPLRVSVEREGYSLSLRSDSGGIQALENLGVLKQLQEYPKGQRWASTGGFVIWDNKWRQIFKVRAQKENDENPSSMRIPRNLLRQSLVDAASSNQEIHWGTGCETAERLENGRIRVTLMDGQTDEGDVLIVADGSSSRLRRALQPDQHLSFAGATCISGTSRFDGDVPSPVDKNWGLVLGGRGGGLFVSPIDSSSAVWSVSSQSSEPQEQLRQPLNDDQVKQLLDAARRWGKHFESPFETLVDATDSSTLRRFNAMDKQPFAHDKEPHIIFIGDSNHAMSPFAGNGANMALIDGWDLAEALLSCTSLADAVKLYDDRSMPRSKSAIDQSHWSISIAHATGLKLWGYLLLFRGLSLFA